MYLPAENLNDAAVTEWDAIVVGAGAVGLIVSVSMARAGKRVVLLESGGSVPGEANELNDVSVTGRPHLGVTHGRGRVVGGTTTMWGGQLTRFVPYDFDAREALSDSRWPLGYGDVVAHYEDVATMLDLDPRYLSDESVLGRLGLGGAAPSSGCEIFYTRWLRDPNLARWFADDLEKLPTLAVVPNCHASAILCGPGGARIIGVAANCADGRLRDFMGRDLVLACGTIEISRLLLLTARKSPAVAWTRNANIGRYFQDHLDLVVGHIAVNEKAAFANQFENVVIDSHKYQPKVRMRTSILRDLGCLNLACTVRFDSAIAEDIQMLKHFVRSLLTGSKIDKPWQSVRRMAALSHVWFPLIWRYLRHRRILGLADRGISVIAHCEQRPLRESRISLDTERTDRFGDPIGRLHWAVDEPLQLKSLQIFAAQFAEFLRDAGGAEFVVRREIASGDPSILEEATDSYHQCGGARMALDPQNGVVDSNCKVFGTENLFLAGAAVFPSSSFANPTFTAMALAKRLSGHLMSGHGHA
jgi:choline dehydrogenase-like flavoprotein